MVHRKLKKITVCLQLGNRFAKFTKIGIKLSYFPYTFKVSKKPKAEFLILTVLFQLQKEISLLLSLLIST